MGKVWFDHPAGKWEEALPIGNGRLGAMIFGGLERERIALNQDSIWYGGPVDRVDPDAKNNLDKVRSLLLEGKIPLAEELHLRRRSYGLELCLDRKFLCQIGRRGKSTGKLE